MKHYLIAQIKNIYGEPHNELIDLSYTTMPLEGILEFIDNVLRLDTFKLYETFLDIDHFMMMHNIENETFTDN